MRKAIILDAVRKNLKGGMQLFCFLMGAFIAGISTLLAYAAFIGHVPVWHTLAAWALSIILLSVSNALA